MKINMGFHGYEPDIKISLEGDTKDKTELKKKSVERLMDSFDLKHEFDGDQEKISDMVEDFLLRAVDIIGYDYYYWDITAKEEKSYNEYDELVVSRKAKIELLEVIVEDMKSKL